MSESMIERVGRRLAAAEGYSYDPVPYDTYARAAIEAIPLADDAFLERVSERMHDGRFSVSGETYPVLRSFLRALADAALQEKQE